MTSDIKSYEDLVAWQKAYALGLRIYEATKSFPKEELFGFTSQLRRGAVSIASNLAEGYGRGATKDYIRFIKMSRGSLYEIETQLRFAADLGYVDRSAFDALCLLTAECGRLIGGLLRSLE